VLCSATRTHYESVSYGQTVWHMAHLLNNIGTELLNRKSTNVSSKLTNDSVTEAVVIQVENVLDNLVV
jgi:hypothetical protein